MNIKRQSHRLELPIGALLNVCAGNDSFWNDISQFCNNTHNLHTEPFTGFQLKSGQTLSFRE